jgi:RimJ/RimL family protein N-acetyltransferase
MDKLSVRTIHDHDLQRFEQWLYQDYVAKWYEHPQDWINEVKNRESEFWFVHHLIVLHEGREIGFCQYYEYKYGGEDWHNNIELEGTYSIDYMIGERAYLGRGFGREIIRTLTKLIFETTNAVRIIVKPEDDNAASINALLSAGYEYDETNDLYIMSN